jgi:hypothetical protein
MKLKKKLKIKKKTQKRNHLSQFELIFQTHNTIHEKEISQ